MTKSRKKILLSSIAMLMVALVALGSATYAWFTVNRTVTADGMSIKAATAQGLQITGDNGTTWKRDWVFKKFKENSTEVDTVLSPVSLAYAATGLGEKAYAPSDVKKDGPFSSDIDSSTTGNQPSAKTWSEIDYPDKGIATLNDSEAKVKDGYFAAYRVGIRSSDEEISGVTMTLAYTSTATTVDGTSVDSKDFIRIVVVDSDGKVVANYGDAANTTANSTAAVKAVASDTPDTSGTQLAASLTKNGLTAPAKTEDAAYYTIYVWFEGQDSQCTDNHQSLDGTVNISFGF